MVKTLCMRATLFKRTAQRVLHLGASFSTVLSKIIIVSQCHVFIEF